MAPPRGHRRAGRVGPFVAALLTVAIALVLLSASGAVAPAATARHTVLIYYANETSRRAAESKNYAALLSILRNSPNPKAAGIADSIEGDARGYPAVVDRDEKALLAAARRLQVDVAVFTNAMAFDGKFLHYRGAGNSIEFPALPAVPAAGNPILATSPLSRPEMFAAALAAVGAIYLPGSVDAVLIANSHGTREMALMPRVSTDLTSQDAAKGLAQVLESGELGTTPPAWAVLQGTGKIEFWRAIADIGARRGMRFPLVFRESCISGPRGWAELDAIPENIGLLAHSALGNLRPIDIDYASVLAAGGDRDLVAAMTSGLGKLGVRVDDRRSLWLWLALVAMGSIHPLWYFVPLALWLVWYAVFRHRARPGNAREPG